MAVVNSGHCRYCWETGHWVNACPLRQTAENRAEHLARIDRITERFLDNDIDASLKRWLIKEENEQWNSKPKAARR